MELMFKRDLKTNKVHLFYKKREIIKKTKTSNAQKYLEKNILPLILLYHYILMT